jgi:hypothetical protein
MAESSLLDGYLDVVFAMKSDRRFVPLAPDRHRAAGTKVFAYGK